MRAKYGGSTEAMEPCSTARPFHIRALLLAVLYVTGSFLFVTSMLSKTVTLTTVSNKTCRGVRGVDQVVVLLVDALRPDFVLPSLASHYLHGEKCSAAGAQGIRGGKDGIEQNRSSLTYIGENLMRADHPSHGFFFLSDTPTVTAQRIKALTTGTTPAFLEVGTNLNTDEVQMDNILLQMRKRSILLGDDTWLNLFPDQDRNTSVWKHTHALPPYNVSDFDTNDETVVRDMLPLLLSETVENAPNHYARLIIGHLLAVDHVGHRHHADHPAMHKKLADTDGILRNISRALREGRRTSMRTLLVVFGDHGMTNSGDHGGDSDGERDSFMYAELFDGSSGQPPGRTAASTALRRKGDLTEMRWKENIDEDLSRLKACRDNAGVRPDKLSAVHQIDLVPTLTTLLGVPIPFSNIGRIIPEVIVLSDSDANLDATERCNWEQIMTYFREAGLAVRPEWEDAHVPFRNRVAHMSNFARSIRMEIKRVGAFVGVCLCMIAALSLLWNSDVQHGMRCRSMMSMGTMFLLMLRLFTVFANSFIIKESIEILSLLQILLLAAVFTVPEVTNSRSRVVYLLAFIMLVLRVVVPLLYRERSHITHTAESTSPLGAWVAANFPEFRLNTIGIMAGGTVFVLCAATLKQRLIGVILGIVMVCCYGWPLVHHLGPLAFFAPTFCLSHGAWLRYSALVLWSSSLCNENYVASASIALSGAFLPVVLSATRHLPPVEQALLAHLYTWVSFYVQGNHCLVNTIDLNASFVGLPYNDVILGTVLVLVRLCNAFLFAPMAVIMNFAEDRAMGWRICYLLLFITVTQSAVSNFNGYIQKSHLMFFPIFCPKFIFDFCIGMGACVGYFLAALLA